MAYKTHPVNSIGELLALLQSDVKGKEPIWFRGQSDSSWSLLPGYQRLSKPLPESVIINRFKQNANFLIRNIGTNKFDWLFYSQHYGVPTRLLDWSESPLFAIYFAVTSNDSKTGALWVLKPLELNRAISIDGKKDDYLPSFEDNELLDYSTETIEATRLNGILPKAAIATRNNPRIQAQLGVFTISHLTIQPIEKIGNGDHIIKYTISPKAKKKLKNELKLLGISKFQLFPELSSVGELIKELT